MAPMTAQEKSQRWREKRRNEEKTLRSKGAKQVTILTSGEHTKAFKSSIDDALQLYYREDELPQSEEEKDRFMYGEGYITSILASGAVGQTATHLVDDELGTAIIEVVARSCSPVIIMGHVKGGSRPLIEADWREEFAKKFPVVRRILDLDRLKYGYDTPEYREICSQLHKNPDYRRPVFSPLYETVGKKWEKWCHDFAVTLAHDGVPQMAVSQARDFMNNIVDLIRTDEYRDTTLSVHSLLDDLRDLQPFLEIMGVPAVEEIETILRSPPTHHTEPAGSGVVIEFLPSSFGWGWRALFTSIETDKEGQGWDQQNYQHVGGVAIYPDSNREWSKVAVKRLEQQGVEFLTDEQAEAYLQTEGEYWRWYHGANIDVGKMKAMMWTIRKPATPVSDRALKRFKAAKLLSGQGLV